jgi:hypothetical protein
MNEYQVKIGNKINSFINKYELIILFVILITIALKLLPVPFSSILLILILTSISTAYFFSAFAISENAEITAIDIFAQKMIGWSSSVTLIGIVFIILKWPNNELMILIGTVSLSIALIYLIIKKVKNPNSEIFNKFLIVRIFILISLSLYLYLSLKN